MKNYKQCKLKRKLKSGFTYTTTWIPEKYAILDKIVKLKDNNQWVDGWEVIHVGTEIKSSDEVNKLSWEYTQHRLRTDI